MIPTKEMIDIHFKVLHDYGMVADKSELDHEGAAAALTAALSVQWRGIDSAPKDGTYILAIVDWLPCPKILFWAAYANEWRCPASENVNGPYHPTLWMPLPLPQSLRAEDVSQGN